MPRKTLFGLGFAVAALALGAAAPGARAQTADVQSLVERVDRLQRELNTLQRQVYRGEPPKVQEGSGPAPEPGGLSNAAAASIELRLSQFEAELRALTGQVEEATFRHTRLSERVDKLASDLDLRLRQLEQGGAGPAAAAGQPPAAAGGAQPPPKPAPGSGPQVLGTVNKSDLEAMQAQRVEPGPAPAPAASSQPKAQQTANLGYSLPGKTPEEQYQNAFGLLSQANYGEAELALRAFVEQHPDSPLAGNAKYWLGETYYVRQDYQQAAITFAEAYQQYPENSKAPDNLLKLGMSLSALGNKSDACGTYAELLKRYPKSAPTILQRAKQERQHLACP